MASNLPLPKSTTSPPYQIYLIGGAIRDALLGLDINDFDYMVVGVNPDNILKTIPNVIPPTNPQHPTYKILLPDLNKTVELALARKETKVAVGYFGFKYEVDGVSLTQDVIRRDLTINTLALPVSLNQILTHQITKDYILKHQEQIIDLTGLGKDDIKHRVFRAVSPQFIDDPIRISRLAKFNVKFKDLGFSIDPSLITLMQQFSLEEKHQLFKPSSKILNQNLEFSLNNGRIIDYLDVFAVLGLITLNQSDREELSKFNTKYLEILHNSTDQLLNICSSEVVTNQNNHTLNLNQPLDTLTSLFLTHLQALDHHQQLQSILSFSQLGKFKVNPQHIPSCFDFVIRHYNKTIIKAILNQLKQR